MSEARVQMRERPGQAPVFPLADMRARRFCSAVPALAPKGRSHRRGRDSASRLRHPILFPADAMSVAPTLACPGQRPLPPVVSQTLTRGSSHRGTLSSSKPLPGGQKESGAADLVPNCPALLTPSGRNVDSPKGVEPQQAAPDPISAAAWMDTPPKARIDGSRPEIAAVDPRVQRWVAESRYQARPALTSSPRTRVYLRKGGRAGECSCLESSQFPQGTRWFESSPFRQFPVAAPGSVLSGTSLLKLPGILTGARLFSWGRE